MGATVCPSCSNLLVISRVGSNAEPAHQGKNRFECRTCPFQYILDKRYFERKKLKRKEVEDVVGGRDAWENVDKTDGMSNLVSDCYAVLLLTFCYRSPMPEREVW